MTVIRAVLDANVIVAGRASATGTPSRIIDDWLNQSDLLALSESFSATSKRPGRSHTGGTDCAPKRAGSGPILPRSDAGLTEITVTVIGIAAHEEDDPGLATAVSANADSLGTGDRELQERQTVTGVELVSPRRFLIVLDTAGEPELLAHRCTLFRQRLPPDLPRTPRQPTIVRDPQELLLRVRPDEVEGRAAVRHTLGILHQ